ncbi:MAG: CocE/NonD family hydrolase [Myxococcota bacterium]
MLTASIAMGCRAQAPEADPAVPASCPSDTPTEPLVTDHRIIADDGVELVFSVFRPADVCAAIPAPLILWNHGYPEFRTNELEDAMVYLERGYGFVSVDQRGIIGESGGVTSGAARPGIEDVDAMRVLDWVYDNVDWALREPDTGVPKDLRVGTFGNGGGGHLSLLVTATDPRIDAVMPYVAYGSVLEDIFIPNGAPRAFWARLFLGFSQDLGVRFDPALLPSIDEASSSFLVDDALREVWESSDTPRFVDDVQVPTMFVQPITDQIAGGLRAVVRTWRSLGTPRDETWIVGMNAPFFDPFEQRGFGEGAPDRERPNQCADLYTPGFDEGLGRFLDGDLVMLFLDAFVGQDDEARARLDEVPRVLLPIEQQGCVRSDAWPVHDRIDTFSLGEIEIPQDNGEVRLPLFTATEPTLITGTVSFAADVPPGQDELFVASLVVDTKDARYVVNDQVLGAQTGRYEGRLDVELGTVVTRLEPGEALELVVAGTHFLYERAGGALNAPASLGDAEVRLPMANLALVGPAEVIAR